MQLNLFSDTNDTPEILKQKHTKPNSLDNIPENCVIVDIETTGFSVLNDSIIEICALKIKNNKIEDEFSSLVRPNKPVPSFISNLTGITNEMLKDAIECRSALKNFCNFIQTNPIVGHNIRFDLSFINKNLEQFYNNTLPNNFFDTLALARKIYNLASSKLTNIANHLNIDTQNAHRALKDCYITYEIIQDMRQKLSK